MRNIKLTLEYDGFRYNGFIQPPKKGNKTTVSGKITDVLSRMESADTVANTATNTTADTATDLPIDFLTDLSTGFSALFCGERTARRSCTATDRKFQNGFRIIRRRDPDLPEPLSPAGYCRI
mgnify:CR=1 FL=1